MQTRRSFIAASAAAIPLALHSQPAVGVWPVRPVKIIVGFPPGQGSDFAARTYAMELQKAYSQPFVVENRPGAGATLAAAAVARAAPDGYTLLFTSSGPLTVAPHLYLNLGFDPMTDLEPVALVGRSPLILLVRPDSTAKSLPDLVALSAGQGLNAGSGGNGVTNHLALEMFKLTSGAKLTHVPYKGAPPALTDLMGGQIQTLFEASSASLEHVKAGRLRALAVTSPSRYSELPLVPTVAEYYPGFDAMTWAMLAVPRGTPDVIKEKLADQLNKSMVDSSVRERLVQTGIEPTPGTSPSKATAYARSEVDKWGSIIRRANVKID